MSSSANSSRATSSRAASSLTASSPAGVRALVARRGFVQVEVNVSKDDASLIRQVAAALSDPARQAATRTLLRQCLVEPSELSLQALLASAPLDGIELDRVQELSGAADS